MIDLISQTADHLITLAKRSAWKEHDSFSSYTRNACYCWHEMVYFSQLTRLDAYGISWDTHNKLTVVNQG